MDLIKDFLALIYDKYTLLIAPEKKQEVYFFKGENSFLCIAMDDDKVLAEFPYSQLEVNIKKNNEFELIYGNEKFSFVCPPEAGIY